MPRNCSLLKWRFYDYQIRPELINFTSPTSALARSILTLVFSHLQQNGPLCKQRSNAALHGCTAARCQKSHVCDIFHFQFIPNYTTCHRKRCFWRGIGSENLTNCCLPPLSPSLLVWQCMPYNKRHVQTASKPCKTEKNWNRSKVVWNICVWLLCPQLNRDCPRSKQCSCYEGIYSKLNFAFATDIGVCRCSSLQLRNSCLVVCYLFLLLYFKGKYSQINFELIFIWCQFQ